MATRFEEISFNKLCSPRHARLLQGPPRLRIRARG